MRVEADMLGFVHWGLEVSCDCSSIQQTCQAGVEEFVAGSS